MNNPKKLLIVGGLTTIASFVLYAITKKLQSEKSKKSKKSKNGSLMAEDYLDKSLLIEILAKIKEKAMNRIKELTMKSRKIRRSLDPNLSEKYTKIVDKYQGFF